MFISKSLKIHLLRGIMGGICFYGCYMSGVTHPLLAVALGLSGLLFLRGCPLCWTMGLIEMITGKENCSQCVR